MPAHTQDEYARRLLDELDSPQPLSQRAISRNLGIALGLTNLMIRRFASKGLIRVSGIKPHRVRYLLTPAGIAEKARLSQAAFSNSIDRYRLARARIQGAFDRISAEWSPERSHLKEIVFYGTGEVAEIGYICLQNTDLQLIGAIDDQGRPGFFGMPLAAVDELPSAFPQEWNDATIVVMSLAKSDEIRETLGRLGAPGALAIWI